MSKLRTLPYAVLAGSLLAGGSAYAQSMYSIDQRQDYQQDRIERGIRSGEITRSEAYRLGQGERAIDRAQSRARADGVVTSQERARIDRMTDRQGQQIYRQSHDNQQAWDRGSGDAPTAAKTAGMIAAGGSLAGRIPVGTAASTTVGTGARQHGTATGRRASSVAMPEAPARPQRHARWLADARRSRPPAAQPEWHRSLPGAGPV